MKIVFMGTPDFAKRILEELVNSTHEVGYVITQPDKARNRGKKVQFTPVKELALACGIPVLQPERVKKNQELYDELKAYNPDIIVVAAFGQILPSEILNLPEYGCINVHASLLPKLRGASPIQNAIVTGEKETGVTIMQMAEGLDTGDMLTKASIEIGRMNFSQLHDALADEGAKLLAATLTMIEEGKVKPEPQNDELATYAGIITKQDGKVNFTESPERIERLIRGFDPWPGAFATLNEVVIKFWSAEIPKEKSDEPFGTVLKADKEGIRISCGGGVLLITEIQVPGKKRVRVEDYLRGNTIEAGTIFE